MSAAGADRRGPRGRLRRGAALLAPALLLAALSAAYEALFVRHGLNVLDEGWPLYAAMRLQEGGTLYRDVFFVFPPGHLLPAWIGRALAPPGLVGARVLYALLNVALCVALYALGRRLMPARLAFFGAALLAVAAPQAHHHHLLFAYRYALFAVLALLAFARRLEGGGRRWMVLAGLAAGVALCFRLTPAFAVAVGIGAGTLARWRALRPVFAEGALFGAGVALAAAPVLLWLVSEAGLESVWTEMLRRPLHMTALQDLPFPEIAWPAWDRREIRKLFTALCFPGFAALYLGYGAALAGRLRRGWGGLDVARPALWVAVVVWGAVFSLRALGRSDGPHLFSALPPVCLLVGQLPGVLRARLPHAFGRRRGAEALLVAALAAVWVLGMETDRYLAPARRGTVPVEAAGGATALREGSWWKVVDARVAEIRRRTARHERILDLAAAPLFYVLSGRRGPGHADVVMPGTFFDAREQRAFLRRLREAPPALVIAPVLPFDGRADRAVWRTAPRLVRWVRRHYRAVGPRRKFVLMVPRERTPSPAERPEPGPRGDRAEPRDRSADAG